MRCWGHARHSPRADPPSLVPGVSSFALCHLLLQHRFQIQSHPAGREQGPRQRRRRRYLLMSCSVLRAYASSVSRVACATPRRRSAASAWRRGSIRRSGPSPSTCSGRLLSGLGGREAGREAGRSECRAGTLGEELELTSAPALGAPPGAAGGCHPGRFAWSAAPQQGQRSCRSQGLAPLQQGLMNGVISLGFPWDPVRI